MWLTLEPVIRHVCMAKMWLYPCSHILQVSRSFKLKGRDQSNGCTPGPPGVEEPGIARPGDRRASRKRWNQPSQGWRGRRICKRNLRAMAS